MPMATTVLLADLRGKEIPKCCILKETRPRSPGRVTPFLLGAMRESSMVTRDRAREREKEQGTHMACATQTEIK